MATTPVEIILPSGLTATLSLYAAGSDTLANSDGADTLTEDSNALGFYTANVTEALDGIHKAKVLVGSSVIANGYIDLADDTQRRYVVPDYLWAVGADSTPLTPGVSPAGFSTGYLYVYDELGAVESGVTMTVQCISPPSTAGLALDTATRTGTSDGSGYVEFTGLVRGAKYQIQRSSSSIYKQFTVPDAASFAISSFLGSE